jgi:hypothetical protein
MTTWMGKKASHRIYGRGNPSPTGLLIIHHSSFIIPFPLLPWARKNGFVCKILLDAIRQKRKKKWQRK